MIEENFNIEDVYAEIEYEKAKFSDIFK